MIKKIILTALLSVAAVNGAGNMDAYNEEILTYNDDMRDEERMRAIQAQMDAFNEGMRDSNAEDQADKDAVNGKWIKVRHVPGTGNWSHSNDNLKGTDVYGDPNNNDEAWSTKFDDKSFTQMMFAFGDRSTWIIMDTSDVYGEYDGTLRDIQQSSSSDSPTQVAMYNRAANPEDPWISEQNHPTNMLYGENSSTSYTSWKNDHDGADVYIQLTSDAGVLSGDDINCNLGFGLCEEDIKTIDINCKLFGDCGEIIELAAMDSSYNQGGNKTPLVAGMIALMAVGAFVYNNKDKAQRARDEDHYERLTDIELEDEN